MYLDVLTFVILAFVGVRLVDATRRVATTAAIRRRWWQIVRGLRLHHFLLAAPILATVVAAVVVLMQLPLLDFGWWSAIGGGGNPVFGVTDTTAGTPWERVIPLVFITILIPALPLFAEREEVMFRLGAESWSFPRRTWKGVKFGLIHALVGIPIGAALAISIGGWYFTWAYLRGYRRGGREVGLLESTRSHLAYNAIAVALVVAAIIAL